MITGFGSPKRGHDDCDQHSVGGGGDGDKRKNGDVGVGNGE